jgi:hypothetical protein
MKKKKLKKKLNFMYAQLTKQKAETFKWFLAYDKLKKETSDIK